VSVNIAQDGAVCNMQVEHQPLLNSTRYNHRMVSWRGQLIVIGGQVDDSTGTSNAVLNVIALDFTSRTWRTVKDFRPASKGASECNATHTRFLHHAANPLVLCSIIHAGSKWQIFSGDYEAISGFVCLPAAAYVFDATCTSGKYLLAAIQVIDAEGPGRKYFRMDLNTGVIKANYVLVSTAT
jgi:hypothetical protein